MPLNRTPPHCSSAPMDMVPINTPFIRRKKCKRGNDGELIESGNMCDEFLLEIKELKAVVLSSNSDIKQILEENKLLRAEVEVLKNIVSKLNGNATGEIVGQTRGNSYADQLSSVVIVKPKDDSQSSSKTKEVLKEKVNPIESQVSGIRKAAKGAVIIECSNKKVSENLKTAVASSLGDSYEVKLPAKKKPKFKLCGMSEKFTEEQMINYLIKQNECLKNESELKVLKTIEKIDKFKNKNYEAIVETDTESFARIMNVDKVFINWDSCKVFEYVSLVRCFKCLGFNHFSKECTRDLACKFCGGKHDSKACNVQNYKCINCMYYVNELKMQLDINHHAFSNECKVLQRKYEEQRKKIDRE